MAIKWTNNASTTLASAISAVATTITVASSGGSLFPSLSAGDYFYATLSDSSNNLEIVKVTAKVGDVMTVVRGQDGTTGTAYVGGDKFELRPTAAGLSISFDKSGDTITGPSAIVVNSSSDALSIEQTGSGEALLVEANGSGNALHITQTGTGNALLVEDSSNPDSTPFVVDAEGTTIIGSTTSQNNSYRLQSVGTNGGDLLTQRWAASTGGSFIRMQKSRGASVGTAGAVSSGDSIATLSFDGDDGAAFIQAATISAEVDGTPGANDMPGRLVFSTTADGASSPIESMRINSAQRLIVQKSSSGATAALTSSSASIAVDMNSANNFTHTTTENTTLANPTNMTAGQYGSIVITQGATARTMAFGSYWKFAGGTVPSLTASPSAVDVLVYYVESSTRITARLIGDVK